jgi:hypothetical protein
MSVNPVTNPVPSQLGNLVRATLDLDRLSVPGYVITRLRPMQTTTVKHPLARAPAIRQRFVT